MLKKTLVGAAMAADLVLPAGVALAQAGDSPTGESVVATADRDRIQLHDPGDCPLNVDGTRQRDRDQIRDPETDREWYQARDQDRDQETHDLNDSSNRKGPRGRN